MVIFHSYVSLPEGTNYQLFVFSAIEISVGKSTSPQTLVGASYLG